MRIKNNRLPKEDNAKESRTSIRINKLIAESGTASRRKADEIISEGRVKVNGKIITELGTMVSPADLITVDGDPIKAQTTMKYYLLNKPKDCITTTKDEKGRMTVLDIVKSQSRIYPVGRLDRNTTGALLLTNDGELANRLTHPRYNIERTYIAGLDKILTHDDANRIAKGIDLGDYISSPCNVYLNPEDKTKAILTLTEGKNREVRNLFEALGYEVKKLDRKSFAGITTSGLARGEYRHLTKLEINGLRRLCGLK